MRYFFYNIAKINIQSSVILSSLEGGTISCESPTLTDDVITSSKTGGLIDKQRSLPDNPFLDRNILRIKAWTAMGVLLNMFGLGMMLSYPSILLPAILSPHSELKADIHVASWAASCVGFSSIFGFFMSSCLMEWYGRKPAHVASVVPVSIGWLLIWRASNTTTLITGRVLCGLSAGATMNLGAVVIGEYTSPRNRGIFLNLKTTGVCFGNTAVHIIGNFLHWKNFALAALLPHFAALLITLTWPESPSWLAARKEFEKCEKSFYWLRGKSEESKKELDELIKAQNRKYEYTHTRTVSENVKKFFGKFTKRDFVKPMIIISISGLLCESCGRHIFPGYALQIMEQVTGNKTHSFYYTLGIDLIILASATCSSVLIKIMKRRTLLLSTGYAALFVLACTCLYLYLSAKEIISKDRTTIPVILFSIYFILSNLGCTSVTLALLGELFPLVHRSTASAMSGFILSILLMAAMKVTPYFLVKLKVYGTFTVFGSLMGLSLTILFFILPETKDKTLQEIEDHFNCKKSQHNMIVDNDETKKNMLPS